MVGARSRNARCRVALAVLAMSVLAVACASSDEGSDVAGYVFVGGPVIPADLSAPLGEPGAADALGTDATQDELAGQCERGRARSCDDLYQRGAVGSSYASFAYSCGGRLDPPPGPGQGPNCRLRSIGHVAAAHPGLPSGDSPTLDGLAEGCAALNGVEACDTLYREAPQGTEYASFGATCGYRTADTRPNACAGFDGIPEGRPLGEAGEDAELDGLAEECLEARLSSCDELYASTDRGSVYEAYAQTCGGRLAVLVERIQPSCDLRFNDPVTTNPVSPPGPLGDTPAFDDLAAACAEGAMRSCDELFARSDLNTDYENFGATCGGRFAAQRRDLQFSAAGECDARVVVVPEGTEES